MATDYYETLGVSKQASADEIKSAYRKLVKQYHPDKNPGDEAAAAKIKEINEAYQTLSDPDKRREYDTFGSARPGGGAGSAGYSTGGFDFGGRNPFSGFEDIFDFFRGTAGFDRTPQHGPKPGASIRVNLRLTFEEAAFGTRKEILIQRTETCEECNGTGAKPGSSRHTCAHCGGTGQIRRTQSSMFGQMTTVEECPECRGQGTIPDEACRACKGTGTVRRQARIMVNIPAGIDNGQTLTLRGEGNAGTDGGRPGDLLVAITVKPDKLFERVGYDLLLQLKISMVQAAMGEEVEIPTLDGKVRYKIPEGTQPGTVFRLKGKGVKHLDSTRVGDLYVKVDVAVPKRLNEKQKKLLRAFADKTKLQKTEFSKPQERF